MRWFTGFWVVATLLTGWAIALVDAFSGTDYVTRLWPILIVATACGVGTLRALARRRLALGGLLAILTAVGTPTFYVYLPNLGLLIAALALLVTTAHDRTRRTTARSRGPKAAAGH